MTAARHWLLVLGDQLDPAASAFDAFDPACDCVWMAEVADEATHVWSAKMRIAVFLAAMRHFAADLEARGIPLRYVRLDAPDNRGSLAAQLQADLDAATREGRRPSKLVMTAPGDWRVLQALRGVAAAAGVPLEVRDDRHFYATVREFAAHRKERKQLRLEFWYRALRRKHGVLMDGDQPVGGQWNYDAENRAAFGREGPPPLPAPPRFVPDAITQEVLDLVAQRFADHPGSLDDFAWPVTPEQARVALESFLRERLPDFGRYQDALWAGEPWLFHSLLSVALNLKLLDPREAVAGAEAMYRAGQAPLAAVEGFIRQILGWREYVRGIYWTAMPDYLEVNALEAHEALPPFFWTGATDMACLRDAIGMTLRHGYAHHIQRLMVTGLYCLLFGVEPRQVHAWYLAVYVDAVEWVELPNTLGMSQFADDGLMASKPYAASGKYIERMGNHCRTCRYRPAESTGPRACPITTLYWDFLLRHEDRLARNPRMVMQVRNLARLDADARAAVRAQAAAHRQEVGT